MKTIFEAFRDSDSPVILIANSNKPIKVFRGTYNGTPYAFGMNAEVAYDLFSPGKVLEAFSSEQEIASDTVTDTETMKLSDGTVVKVAGDTAIALANEQIFSPVNGEKVTIAFDDSEDQEEVENTDETESMDTDSESEVETENVESEPDTIDETMVEDDSEGSDESETDMSDDTDESDMDSEGDDTDTEMEDVSLEDTEDDSEGETEEDVSDEMDSEEVPEEVEVEAASFTDNHNHRFVAFDSVASEIAVFAGDTHVATLVKKNAHESKRDLFNKPLIATAFNKAAEEAGYDYNHEALKPYGISVTKFKVNVPGVTKKILDNVRSETASVVESDNASYKAKFDQTIKLALMGIAKGVQESTVINELASAFEAAGVANAKTIIASSLSNVAPSLTKQVIEIAADLATKPEDYLRGLAEVTAKASFVGGPAKDFAKPTIVSTNFHIPKNTPSKEVASETASDVEPRKVRVNIFTSIRRRNG